MGLYWSYSEYATKYYKNMDIPSFGSRFRAGLSWHIPLFNNLLNHWACLEVLVAAAVGKDGGGELVLTGHTVKVSYFLFYYNFMTCMCRGD